MTHLVISDDDLSFLEYLCDETKDNVRQSLRMLCLLTLLSKYTLEKRPLYFNQIGNALSHYEKQRGLLRD